MGTKYVDVPAIIQVLGCVYQNPSLLEQTDKYFFNEEDFPEKFHKILFGSIYNLFKLGAKEINPNTIEDYLSSRPKMLAIYKTNKGREYLDELQEKVQLSTFDYYYQRVKKMTLLREYNQKVGMNLAWLYDPDNIFDSKKKQYQEDWLDNTSLVEIADTINKKIDDIKLKCIDNVDTEFSQAGDSIIELVENLQKNPEIGYPMFGNLFNSITRGARLRKFYLRSASTGVGKTRAMIADACTIACDELFDINKNEWMSNNTKEPTIFISTEQEIDEIQTMMLAFIAEVNEDHILYNNYYEGEYERVLKAAKILSESPLYIKQLPDFSLQDIENTIKLSIREWDIKYVFMDYIHSSMKILSEISSKAGVKGLREDNILFMISVRLKDLCNQYGVFIMSATQLNGDYTSAQVYDQNLLRGAKSIADKIDLGEIMLQTSAEDKEALSEFCKKNGYDIPDIKVSVYKNRRGRYKDVLIWCKAKREVCKIEPMFVTNYQYELINIPELKINIKKPIASAF
jgi:replicative DNA helicase